MIADYDTFEELEQGGWSESRIARAYAEKFAMAAAQCVPAMVAAVKAGPGTRALDLCCGHGIVSRGLIDAGSIVTGLDFSPVMLAFARKNVPEARFVSGDAMQLDFADAAFDAVTIGFGIPHVPDAEQVFANVRRVLAPGGRLAFSVWHGPAASPAFRFVFEAIATYGDPKIQLPPGPDAHTYADRDTAFAALEQAGFRDMALETVASNWRVADPGAPYDFFLEGTVRGAALLRRQPEPRKRAIRNAVAEAVRKTCGAKPPFEIAIPAAVVSATA